MILQPSDRHELQKIIVHAQNAQTPLIPYGNGCSYGDSALSPCSLQLHAFNHFLSFDATTGILHCQAGMTLQEILHLIVPRGWFLPVTPGTQFVTLGGAIASDVHGKNHHHIGCFSNYVHELTLMLGNGETLQCSHTQHADLFHATCGGMGLTGVIIDARIQLIPIQSTYIEETSIRLANLTELFSAFEKFHGISYSVAWLDCLAKGKDFGRAILMLGEHAVKGDVHTTSPQRFLTVPCGLPKIAFNKYSLRGFNAIKYHLQPVQQTKFIHYQNYFYPLDKLHHWNKLYGKSGFMQYQFVLPASTSAAGMQQILAKIAASEAKPYLAVFKAFGAANANYLSFPMQGYTLALDFPVNSSLFPLLETLDAMVLEYGGRVYLTKDARMQESTFKQSYPTWQKFVGIREKYHAGIFLSTQAKRLGI